jgi:alkylation response protein AidB-like acyl-CoA dehydrogenase
MLFSIAGGVMSQADETDAPTAVLPRPRDSSDEGPRREDRLLVSLARPDMVREVAQRYGEFLKKRVDPGAHERDRQAAPFSRDLLEEAGELGLMGYMMPTEIGGQGQNWHNWGLVLHELCYLCADTSLPMLLAYCGTVTKLLYETGRPDLIERYVKPMVRGQCIGGFAWSEGRDVFAFRTVLRKRGNSYVLTGAKGPIANGLIADVVMTFAKSEETGDIVGVLVERDDRGLEVTPAPAMGLRASGMAKWSFNEVPLPAERIFVSSDGVSYAQRFFNERRLEMCCWALGRMRSLLESCLRDLSSRIRYGLPLTEMQTIQATAGRMYIGLETSRLVLGKVLDRIDRGEYDWLWDPRLSVLKHHVIDEALRLCRSIQDISGGYAVFEQGPYERHIRDLQCLNPIAGTMATLAVDLGVLVIDEALRNDSSKHEPQKGVEPK